MHVVDHLHDFLAKFVGHVHRRRFAVNADDGLGIRLAQVYPTIREVNLHTVDIVDLRAIVLGEQLYHLDEDGVDIGLRGEVDAVLRNLIVWEGGAQLAGCAALLCQ